MYRDPSSTSSSACSLPGGATRGSQMTSSLQQIAGARVAVVVGAASVNIAVSAVASVVDAAVVATVGRCKYLSCKTVMRLLPVMQINNSVGAGVGVLDARAVDVAASVLLVLQMLLMHGWSQPALH